MENPANVISTVFSPTGTISRRGGSPTGRTRGPPDRSRSNSTCRAADTPFRNRMLQTIRSLPSGRGSTHRVIVEAPSVHVETTLPFSSRPAGVATGNSGVDHDRCFVLQNPRPVQRDAQSSLPVNGEFRPGTENRTTKSGHSGKNSCNRSHRILPAHRSLSGAVFIL